MILDKKIYHFYHAYADGNNSLPVVQKHLENIITSELSKHLEKIYIGIVGSDVNREKIKEILLSYVSKISLEIIIEATEGFEQITLEKLREHSQSNQGYYFYAHTKSAMNSHHANRCWMHTMEHYNLMNWIEAIRQLKSNDAVGCFWLTHHRHPNLITPNTNSFFAGNYWWSKSEIISSLPPLDTSNRYMAEQWIGNKQDLIIYDLRPGWPRQRNFNCTNFWFDCKCTRKWYFKRTCKIFFGLVLMTVIILLINRFI